MYITIEEAVKVLTEKKPVIIFDAENEYEGDVVFPSDIIDKDIIKFMMNHCKGVICQTLTEDVIKQKQIPIFKKTGQTKTGQTNFIYPVDHVKAHSGISCMDRVMTIKAMIDPHSTSADFAIPGHQNLLKISTNGVLDRQGHTESSSDLVHLAGYSKSAVICEIIDDEGIPMGYHEVKQFSEFHKIPVVLLSDIHNYFLHKNNIQIIPGINFEKNPYEKLHNSVCVLTGGSRGIGKAIKTLLLENKCHVIDLSRESGCDITQITQIKQALENVPSIDYLINCAGHINVTDIKDTDIIDWTTHFDVNVFAPFVLTKLCIPLFSKTGTIINICSPSAHKNRIGWSGYCASKAALLSLTTNSAQELEEHGIKVYGVSPSKTDTRMLRNLFPNINENELLTPKDVALLTINILARRDKINNGEIFSIKKET